MKYAQVEPEEQKNAAHGEVGPDPLTETQDGAGPAPDGQHSQQFGADVDPESQGSQPDAEVGPSKVTLGRHVTHTDGFEVKKKEHTNLIRNRRESEKAFEKKASKK
jgi:hypothetical protein